MNLNNSTQENQSAKRLLTSALLLTDLTQIERKELQRLAATLLLKAQKRKNEQSLIAGIEEEINGWEHSATASGSDAEKIKVVSIVDGLQRELQAQKLRENLAAREVNDAYGNFNLFKGKLSIVNPLARKSLEEFRSRMEDVLEHLPNLVSRSKQLI